MKTTKVKGDSLAAAPKNLAKDRALASKEDPLVIEALQLSREKCQKVEAMLATTRRKVPNFWEEETTETFYVPVENAKLRVFHIKPKNPAGKRPIVFIPGWGVLPAGFMDFYEAVHGLAEIYYIETREKGSSQINRRASRRKNKRKTKFNMSLQAQDIQAVINYFKLADKDFVLLGPCWGASIILQGLLDGVLKAPTFVTFDPMHKLWFSRFVLTYIGPLLPLVQIFWRTGSSKVPAPLEYADCDTSG